MKTRVYMMFLCADCTEQKRTVVARYSVHDLVLQRREKSVMNRQVCALVCADRKKNMGYKAKDWGKYDE